MPFSYHTKVGARFGSRVITELLSERDTDGHLRCRWQCDCGNSGAGGLKAFRLAKSCPQCRRGNLDNHPSKHAHATRPYRTHLYDARANMMQRTNPKSGGPRNRKWYSDKGITVCAEWRKFEGFRDWAVANGYQRGLSLDRDICHPEL